MRGYGSAWTAMSEVIAFYSELPSTSATVPVTVSQAFVDHRRVWGWFALQSVAFTGSVAFLIHIRMHNKYPIADPLLRGLMLDVDMPDDEKGVAKDHMDTWPEDFKDTFIVWEHTNDKSAFTLKGPLREVRFVSNFSR